jgi:O-methyltransferase involved in polyketide biosynthesis
VSNSSSGSDSISPTAHYTGYVWARNGLSHPALVTNEGRVLFASLEPAMRISRTIGGPSLENYLLARHEAIDSLLERAIEEDGVTQVVEVAAGLTPRGWRFSQRYGERITYIEADLPAMAERKRRALRRIGSLSEHHQVRDLDALKQRGPESLHELAADLEPERGLVIITEGLLGYLPTSDVLDLWHRLAEVLSTFRSGRYLSDLHLGNAVTPVVRGFRVLLSGFVRGRVYMHFQGADEAVAALEQAGFASARVLPASGPKPGAGGRLAHILEASIDSA